jgi:hypothetical protein
VAAVTVADDDPPAVPVDAGLEEETGCAGLVVDALEELTGDALKDVAEAVPPVAAGFDGDESVGAALDADRVCSASDNDLVRVSIAFSTSCWAVATAVCADCAASSAFWQPTMSGG